MKKFGVIGLLLVLAAIPLAQFSISNFNQYSELQREADEEAIECTNAICFGEGMTALKAKEHFDSSLYYLMSVLLIAPIGVFIVGLNWRDLIEK
jgi:hypothetical protein